MLVRLLLIAAGTPTASAFTHALSSQQPLFLRRAAAGTVPRSPSISALASSAVIGSSSSTSSIGRVDGESCRAPGRNSRRLRHVQMSISGNAVAAVIGGTFAGGLHAVTGPDHLAALLPLCMGRRWWIAMNTGGFWGLGHGIGAAAVGALAFALRGALNLDVLSSYMEAAVGISIMIIGINGIRESREWATEHDGPTEVAKQHSLEVAMSQPRQEVGIVSTLGTGILHGCSGSGHLLGVMPALAMPSWQIATTYLVSATPVGLMRVSESSCLPASLPPCLPASLPLPFPLPLPLPLSRARTYAPRSLENAGGVALIES